MFQLYEVLTTEMKFIQISLKDGIYIYIYASTELEVIRKVKNELSKRTPDVTRLLFFRI